MKVAIENNIVTARAETLQDIEILIGFTKGRWPKAEVTTVFEAQLVPVVKTTTRKGMKYKKKNTGVYTANKNLVLEKFERDGFVDSDWFEAVRQGDTPLWSCVQVLKDKGYKFTANRIDGNFIYTHLKA